MGCLYDDFSLTLASGHRSELLGPLFYHAEQESQRQWAMPPLWSRTTDAEADFSEFDLLYPVLTVDRFGSEHRFQIFQLFAFGGGSNQEEEELSRFTLFPLYFQQRSPDAAQNYTALVPVYGTLKNRLFRDEIDFVLFPLYSKTRKRDVVTDNYLFPVFHLRRGDQLSGWQVWPLVGHEHKGPTLKINPDNDSMTIAGHDKWFALWPVFFNTRTGIGTTNPAVELSILPAYSQLRSVNRDSTTVLWPFFSYVDDREKKYHEWELPWPLVIFARGEGKTANRIWPLFSRVHDTAKESAFYLWPLYKYNRVHSDPLDRERTRILLFLYSDVIQRNTATGKYLHQVDFWPLFTYHKEYNGDSRLQILAPIEPILPNHKSVERNWSPLWSLWRSEVKGDQTAASQSLLWNLYRHETRQPCEKYSLLFGLFHYQSDAESWRCRLAGIPVLWGGNGPAQSKGGMPQFQPVENNPVPGEKRLEHPDYGQAEQSDPPASAGTAK